ncbi:ABC transporter ATP-binding protein [Thermodesulfobacteriota bacterium]
MGQTSLSSTNIPYEAGESQRATFTHDLDENLCYAKGTLVLTNRRLIHEASHAGTVPGPQQSGRRAAESWLLTEDITFRAFAYTGIGELELRTRDRLLARLHYTIGRHAEACAFVERFEALAAQSASGESDGDEQLSPHESSAAITAEGPADGASETTMRSLARLVRFAKPWKGLFFLSFILSLACTTAGLIPPYMTMPLIDNILVPFQNGAHIDESRVIWYLTGLGGAAVLAWLLGWPRTYVLAWVSERVSAELRNTIYSHLHGLSLEYFSEKRTGDLIARVSTDTDRICYFLSVQVLDFGADVLMIVMTAGILLYINPLLAVVTLCPFPLIAWLTYRVRKILRRGFAKGIRAWSEMTSVLADAIPGIRVVKAFAQEQREIDRFKETNDYVLRANDRVNTVWSFFKPLVTLLTDFGVLVIWGFAVWLIFQNRITVGVLMAFVAYISRFYSRLESMILMVSATQRAAASAKRIFEIIDEQPHIVESPHPVEPGRLNGKIELKKVGFSYGKRDVLQNVSLTIMPGEMIGFVGPSGSGKTTLVNLVCRFYDVCEGAVYVDDMDIRDLSIAGYRQNIGIVLQEPFLFYGTIAENIAYGRPDAGQTEIIDAARAACAHDFIIRLPDGYDTLVGERGQLLSGGERQRISIARAILISPAILILDEATSSVDVETEKEIQQALENLIEGRTTVAVAHRLSTLKRADRIVVLEDGRITGVGGHRELLNTSKTYARFHRTNAEMYLATMQHLKDDEETKGEVLEEAL